MPVQHLNKENIIPLLYSRHCSDQMIHQNHKHYHTGYRPINTQYLGHIIGEITCENGKQKLFRNDLETAFIYSSVHAWIAFSCLYLSNDGWAQSGLCTFRMKVCTSMKLLTNELIMDDNISLRFSHSVVIQLKLPFLTAFLFLSRSKYEF